MLKLCTLDISWLSSFIIFFRICKCGTAWVALLGEACCADFDFDNVLMFWYIYIYTCGKVFFYLALYRKPRIYRSISYHIWMSKWLNLTAFLGTADSEVHIVPISRVIIISYMKYRIIDSISQHIPHNTMYDISCHISHYMALHAISYHTKPCHMISHIMSLALW